VLNVQVMPLTTRENIGAHLLLIQGSLCQLVQLFICLAHAFDKPCNRFGFCLSVCDCNCPQIGCQFLGQLLRVDPMTWVEKLRDAFNLLA